MSTVSFLVLKGHSLNELITASYSEKLFYMESVRKHLEIENQKYQAQNGVR
jgi:hypothetical protein